MNTEKLTIICFHIDFRRLPIQTTKYSNADIKIVAKRSNRKLDVLNTKRVILVNTDILVMIAEKVSVSKSVITF